MSKLVTKTVTITLPSESFTLLVERLVELYGLWTILDLPADYVFEGRPLSITAIVTTDSWEKSYNSFWILVEELSRGKHDS